jgi:uncharacterized SAM-binding protein YcdF (DUF218 family)
MSPPEVQHKRVRWALAACRLRWGLTWRGWVLLLLLLAGAGWFVVRGIHSFLAVDAPVRSPLVAVEGWVPAAVLREVARRYAADEEALLFTTGGPTEQAYDSTKVEDTHAAEAAQMLRACGMAEDRLWVVPSWVSQRDRTYASAVALRDWLKEQGRTVKALNVVTEGPHSRRSRLMFEAAFGPEVTIGVISIPDREYDPDHWWRYSEGVKAVVSETAAYLYARCLFRTGER